MSGSLPVAAAVGVFLAYTALVALLWRVNHVSYERLAESRDSVLRGIVVPIGLGAVLLAVATTVLGWWAPALVQSPRSGPTWALAVPVLLGVTALISSSSIDLRSTGRRVLPLLAVGVLLVGFAEELLTRGLLLVGARDAGWAEPAAFLLSAVLFALLHGINALFGQSVAKTAGQVVVAFVAGAAFYVTRMTTGSLVVAMLLHALWDFGQLGTIATGRTLRPAVVPFTVLTFVAGLVATAVVLLG